MDPLHSFSSKSKPKSSKGTNFIEALKDFGTPLKQQAKDLTLGTGRNFLDQIFGTAPSQSTPASSEQKVDQPHNFEDFLKSRERQIAFQERRRYEHKIEEERIIFHRKQEEAKLQIKAVQEELKKLADATGDLSVEIKKATFTAVVDPGTYHENFFDRIRKLIALARTKITESTSWLETFNNRCKKRSYYWGAVQTSGTKFMLSHERYMATQAG